MKLKDEIKYYQEYCQEQAKTLSLLCQLEAPDSRKAKDLAEQIEHYKKMEDLLMFCAETNQGHGEVLYTARILLEPRSKKNNQVIKYRKNENGTRTPFISQGDLYKQYEKDCAFFLRRPKQGVITEKVNVRYIFYRSNYKVVDISNCIAAADDILVKYKVIKDDCFKYIAGHDGTRLMIDKENPRTEVYIERW